MIKFKLLLLMLVVACACEQPVITTGSKINGVSYVASRDSIRVEHLQPLEELGANYASIMPYAFMRDTEQPELFFNTGRQWYGETYVGADQYIKALHARNIRVMLKPHIWIGGGSFTGDLNLDTEEAWAALESEYERYIMLYARLAAENDVEIYCLGTELFNFVQQRTTFWKQLITKVRGIYKGKLTYAENWDKVDQNPLWEHLDFVGVDAYFPVSLEQTPTVEVAQKGWKPHKDLLKRLSHKYRKPVLFTEFGYRSVDYAGKEPWHTERSESEANLPAQLHLTQALFNEFWDESWFAGGFIWKWHHDHAKSGGLNNNRFTPQNKPVQEFLKKRFNLKKE